MSKASTGFMISAIVALAILFATVGIGIGAWGATWPPMWFFTIIGLSGAWTVAGSAIATVIDE